MVCDFLLSMLRTVTMRLAKKMEGEKDLYRIHPVVPIDFVNVEFLFFLLHSD